MEPSAAITAFLAVMTSLVTSIVSVAGTFGNVLMTGPYAIFLALAVIGVGFSWFRGFIGARG